MRPDESDLEKITESVKEAFLQTVKQRAVDRLIKDNNDRLERYYAKLSNELSEKIQKEFPL